MEVLIFQFQFTIVCLHGFGNSTKYEFITLGSDISQCLQNTHTSAAAGNVSYIQMYKFIHSIGSVKKTNEPNLEYFSYFKKCLNVILVRLWLSLTVYFYRKIYFSYVFLCALNIISIFLLNQSFKLYRAILFTI